MCSFFYYRAPRRKDCGSFMFWVLKAILKPILLMIYRISWEGRDNVPQKGPAIIAASHLSFLDSFFIPLVVRRRKVIFLAKSDYFESWKTAWFFKMMGQLPMDREGGKKSQQALELAAKVLGEGKLLAIYPEGTRSQDGRLHKGRTGVARIAFNTGVPVVPCGLAGTAEIMPKNARFPRLRGRRRVVVKFGKPLDFSRFAGKELDRVALRSATDEIMQQIQQLTGQEYVDEYNSSRASEAPSGTEGDGGRDDPTEETLAG